MDFKQIWIEVECPKCKYLNDVRLLEVKLETIICCSNCKAVIKLKDNEASFHKGINEINNLLTDLDSLFK